jgi:hypothetical protein
MRCVLRSTLIAAALLGASSRIAAGHPPSCALRTGAPVILRSSDFDPNVFVWDTRDLVVAYEGRQRWIPTNEVLRRTVLATAGTRGVVVACTAGVVHPVVVDGVFDAVRVRLLSGTHRGHTGWITSSDIKS